jgi:dihydropteroate synthase
MRLRLRDTTLDLEPGRPLLMGILNAAPDSFSDPGRRSATELARRGRELVVEGAAIVDVGGESGRTDRPPVSQPEEIARMIPAVERLAAEGTLVSVDTWRASVARAALAAGASMVNDVSGLSDPGLAEACAEHGAALVVTHTRLPPKSKGFPAYPALVDEVAAELGERAALAGRLGVGADRLLVDPGLDLAKTPAQSVELLKRLPELAALGHPLLVAPSRKDFVGALTDRRPAARVAGTLAALGAAADGGAAVVRVHDVAAARDYLAVRAALRGEAEVPEALRLPPELRREPEPGEAA